MRQNITTYLDNVITFLLFVVAGATPLIVFNQTTEFFEMPKLVFLLVATILLVGLWILSWIFKGKIVINRTPLDIPLLILLVVVLLSTYFSTTKFAAIYGNFPRFHGSAVSWVVYILLYFVAVSHLKTLNRIKSLLYVFYASGIALSVISVLSFFKIYLPFDFAKAVNFTPAGSTFSTIAFLLMLLPLPLLSLAKNNKYLPMPFAMVLSILFSAVIVLIGNIPAYAVLIGIFALVLFIVKPHKLKAAAGLVLVPVITTAIMFALSYVPLPGGLNVIQSSQSNFPREVQLPVVVSWKVSASAFRDAPFIGTGPSSYLFNFTTYKPLEFNQQSFWNFSFDTAYNEYFQVLGTLGMFGFLGIVIVSIIVVANAWRNITLKDSGESIDNSHVLITGLALSGLVSIVLLFIHATTLVSLVATLFVLAALMMSQKAIREKVLEFSVGIKALTQDNKQFDLFPVVLFIVFVILAVPVLYKTYNVVLADYYHRLALSQANRNGTLTYQYLQKAESLNPEVDLYRVDMAQINFALANALASQKGPTEANPQGTLTDDDRKTIQTLLTQAVNEGRAAVALNPRYSRNWEVLGSVYRNITGVAQNAIQFALDSYGNAIQRDPLNPALRLSVGGIYYSTKNYDLAIRFFSDAINLKPDYANGYFNLAVALENKGDLQNASLVANQLVVLLQKDRADSADYKLANEYLGKLKEKLAANNKTQSDQSAPAAQTGSALQQQNVSGVEVENLNNPPQVVEPSPVRSNPNANIPQFTPTPTPAAQVTPTPVQ